MFLHQRPSLKGANSDGQVLGQGSAIFHRWTHGTHRRLSNLLLVIQFESGSVGSGYEIRGGVAREALQLATSVLFEEGDILVLELHGLFGTVSRTLHRVFPYPKKVVKSNHC